MFESDPSPQLSRVPPGLAGRALCSTGDNWSPALQIRTLLLMLGATLYDDGNVPPPHAAPDRQGDDEEVRSGLTRLTGLIGRARDDGWHALVRVKEERGAEGGGDDA
jgi:hypothetical protein